MCNCQQNRDDHLIIVNNDRNELLSMKKKIFDEKNISNNIVSICTLSMMKWKKKKNDTGRMTRIANRLDANPPQ
jgi:hypothetical protein